jgi:transposase
MQVHDQLARMDAQQLREFAADLIETLASKDHELRYKELKIEQLTHEMALLKRWKFAARSEQLHGEQRRLFDEAIDADLEAIATELATLRSAEHRQARRICRSGVYCRRTCRASTCATSRSTPFAVAVAR